ncbi:MAG: hypothetical protein HPY53_05495 [Brevinematales bacterium]|nr:hypothetical protein [Brevinematales bacterium]
MEFQIRMEDRNPEYSYNPEEIAIKRKKYVSPLLICLFAILGMASSASPADVKTAGVPVYNPEVYSVTSMTVIVDKIIQDNIDIKMKHSVPLKLKTDDGKTIEFIADGYNAEKKLAYEWIAAPDYSKDKKATEILTTNDIAFIKNAKFGDTIILVIDKKDKIGMQQYVSTYMYLLKNKDKAK